MTITGKMAAYVLFLTACLACSGPRMEAPEHPLPEAAAVTAAPLPTIPYAIQAGAFSTAERAEAYALRLQRRGLDAYYTIDEDGLFKVRFDRFATREAALQRAGELAAQGIIRDFYVVQPLSERPPFSGPASWRPGGSSGIFTSFSPCPIAARPTRRRNCAPIWCRRRAVSSARPIAGVRLRRRTVSTAAV